MVAVREASAFAGAHVFAAFERVFRYKTATRKRTF
jgi:hypothetical protein